MDDAEQLMPAYLRFVRGVVDSADLPLNVSREILQQSKDVEAIRSGCVRRVLGLLDELVADKPEKYAEFWREFGVVLKEGVGEDFSNRDRIAKLLRFASTHDDAAGQTVSLADYLSRMKEGQDKIWYVTAETAAAARNSPHLEIFRKRGIEVLLLGDRVDPWITGQWHEFDGKQLQDASRGDLGLDELADAPPKAEAKDATPEQQALFERMAAVLGDSIEQVRASDRLTESPACLTRDDNDLSEQMRRMLAAAGRGDLPAGKASLEVNLSHPLLALLPKLGDDDFAALTRLLFDQSRLTEQGQLENPGEFVRRLNHLLVKLATAAV
jgi:molecular chaperone HtpG